MRVYLKCKTLSYPLGKRVYSKCKKLIRAVVFVTGVQYGFNSVVKGEEREMREDREKPQTRTDM
jgi:hypothetical protein